MRSTLPLVVVALVVGCGNHHPLRVDAPVDVVEIVDRATPAANADTRQADDALEPGDALELAEAHDASDTRDAGAGETDAPPICGSEHVAADWTLAALPCGPAAHDIQCMTSCYQISSTGDEWPLPSCVMPGPPGSISGLCVPDCAACQ